MNTRPELDTYPLWVGFARVLSGIGGALYSMKGVWFALTLLMSLPSSFDHWAALLVVAGIVGLIGMIGVVAAGWTWRTPIIAAISQGIAGSGGVVLDASGNLPGLPVWPGVVLLVASVITYTTRQRDRGHKGAVPILIAHVLTGFGLMVHGVIAIPIAAFGLGVPAWALLGAFVLWALILVGMLKVRRRFPWLLPVVPVMTYLFIERVLMWGGLLLDWRA